MSVEDLSIMGKSEINLDSKSESRTKQSFQDSIILLDVRGKIYKTTINTLRNCPDSFFSGLTNFLNSNEPYFIDRSPEYFPYILDYLSNLKLPIKLFDEKTLYYIYQEANYYNLSSLKSQIEKISPRCKICNKIKIDSYDDEHCELGIDAMYHPGTEYKIYDPPLFRIGDKLKFIDKRNKIENKPPIEDVEIIDIIQNNNESPRLLKIKFQKWSDSWNELISEFSENIIMNNELKEKENNCEIIWHMSCCKKVPLTQGCKLSGHKFN
jgi:hypothetical protein